MSALPRNVEAIHPALWRGSQLARAYGRTIDTGYAELSEQLPGAGWPLGTLIELMVSQDGVGEMRLLAPALAKLADKRTIALVAPRKVPQALGLAYQGIDARKLMWLKAKNSNDALWSAEQILKTGSCGALLLWQQHIRSESLRRLLLVSQSSETLFVLMRPIACAQDASPATLRLTVRPCEQGVTVEVIKRKGPSVSAPLVIELAASPILISPHRRKPLREVGVPAHAIAASVAVQS